ncbi:MAG: type II secretion system protein, partial [Pseudomonadota bacterium]
MVRRRDADGRRLGFRCDGVGPRVARHPRADVGGVGHRRVERDDGGAAERCPMSLRPRTPLRAFTLVELLVVIAIVA